MEVEEDIAGKEKAEPSLAVPSLSVFNGQTSYPRGSLLPDLEVWDREQKKAPMIQAGTVRELLLPRVRGAGWDPPMGAEERACWCRWMVGMMVLGVP